MLKIPAIESLMPPQSSYDMRQFSDRRLFADLVEAAKKTRQFKEDTEGRIFFAPDDLGLNFGTAADGTKRSLQVDVGNRKTGWFLFQHNLTTASELILRAQMLVSLGFKGGGADPNYLIFCENRMLASPLGVRNGDFSSDASGWTADATATIAAVGSQLVITSVGAANGYCYQVLQTTPGKTYRVRGYHRNDGGHGMVYLGTAAGGSQLWNSGDLNDAALTAWSKTFVATTATTYLNLWVVAGDPAITTKFDTIVFEEVTFSPNTMLEQVYSPRKNIVGTNTGGIGEGFYLNDALEGDILAFEFPIIWPVFIIDVELSGITGGGWKAGLIAF